MGEKRLKISITKKCEICGNEFQAWYKKTKSCSKVCKNELARKITQKQFSTLESRKNHSYITKKAMDNPNIRKNFEIGMSNRKSYKKENHPRWGIKLDDITKQKISKGNKGKSKGKTWEERYGIQEANKRRKNTANRMAETNSKLLKKRTSKLEKQFLFELEQKGYISNKQISKYTVDYVNESTKHIIEINGDYWHCNPKLFKSDYYNSSIGMTAFEKWKYDEERKKYLENLGYSVTILWESDLKSNKSTIHKLN